MDHLVLTGFDWRHLDCPQCSLTGAAMAKFEGSFALTGMVNGFEFLTQKSIDFLA
jgi:hypothetical protein